MATLLREIRSAALLFAGCAVVCVPGSTQEKIGAAPGTKAGSQSVRTAAARVVSTAPPPVARVWDDGSEERPLPDIATLMRDVEANQRKAEAIEKDYLYNSVVTEQEVDGRGKLKKTEVTEYEHSWENTVPVARMVKKDGKPLSAHELAKEDARIDKESAKEHERREKEDAKGNETDPRGNGEVTVSRLLALGTFTKARRVELNGRDTIAVDFAGDPKAKTHNRTEEMIRDMVGTAWIDEPDHVLAKVEGHFVNSFKVGGGLLVNIQKGTRFAMEQTKVNDEVWLPARIDAQGAARVLLVFNFSGSLHAVESDYHKFRTSSTILPGMRQVEKPPTSSEPEQP